jgi:hypothetical protein
VVVNDRALAVFHRADKLVAHTSDEFDPVSAGDMLCYGIGVNNTVGFRIDDEDGGLDFFEDLPEDIPGRQFAGGVIH